jgi:RNA polymerase sigma-70 factor (ECF subfamily)
MSSSQERSATSVTLLERLRANESQAWQRMVQLYSPLVLHWCGRLGLRGADADDVAQEVFAEAAASLARFRREGEGDTFRGWLRGITRNLALAYFRRSSRQPRGQGGTGVQSEMEAVADPQQPPTEADADAEQEVNALLRRALELVRGDFEERTWQMFWLTVVEDRPSAEVATALEVGTATVRKARSRILHRLREEFGELLQ